MKSTAFALLAFVSLWIAPARAEPEVRVAPTVFVVPDPAAKATTFTMIVKAGSGDEPHGKVHGLAHYLEHLVFLGRNADHKATAARFFPDAESNGYTTKLATVFWQKFPLRPEGQTGDLEKLFGFYSGILKGLEVNEDEARRERGVVLQEYNLRFGRSAQRRYIGRINRLLYPDHPRGQDGLGTKEEIEALSAAEAYQFRNAWYTRDNTVFVVHGPVDVEAVKALAAKYIAAVPPRPNPDRAWLNTLMDFSPLDARENVVDKDVREVLVSISKLVRFEETDRRRANAVRVILGSFLRSSLDGSPKDAFVDQSDLADEAPAVGIERPLAGALELTFYVTPKQGVGQEAIVEAYTRYFGDLAARGLDEKVVERLKKRYAEARAQYAKQPQSVAENLVNWFAGRNSYEEYLDNDALVAKVEAADVDLMLRALALPGRRVAGSLSPAP